MGKTAENCPGHAISFARSWSCRRGPCKGARHPDRVRTVDGHALHPGSDLPAGSDLARAPGLCPDPDRGSRPGARRQIELAARGLPSGARSTRKPLGLVRIR